MPNTQPEQDGVERDRAFVSSREIGVESENNVKNALAKISGIKKVIRTIKGSVDDKRGIDFYLEYEKPESPKLKIISVQVKSSSEGIKRYKEHLRRYLARVWNKRVEEVTDKDIDNFLIKVKHIILNGQLSENDILLDYVKQFRKIRAYFIHRQKPIL